jgi:prepilin-type N-terminal cleavage/methylation domain-containing protein
MDRNCFQNERGFTLAELMVVLAIFLMMSGGIFQMTVAAQNIWNENKAKIEVQQNLRKAMEAIVNDIRQTGSITITDATALDTSYSTLTFKKPSTITGGNIVWNSFTTKYQLDAAGQQLQKVENAATTTVATKITAITFSRPSTNAVHVALSAQAVSSGGRTAQRSITFDVQMRN